MTAQKIGQGLQLRTPTNRLLLNRLKRYLENSLLETSERLKGRIAPIVRLGLYSLNFLRSILLMGCCIDKVKWPF